MMKQKIISLCVVAFMAIAHGYCGVTLTVPVVKITPGGSAYVVMNFDLGSSAYTAYQMDIAYPTGISSLKDNAGNPEFIKGNVYDDGQNVSSIYINGLDRFQCFSVNSDPFTAQSGTLLMMPVKAQNSMAPGTYQATISPIEFVKTDGTPDRPDAIVFNIVVSNDPIVLDETSIVPPLPANGVDVTVKRAIKANEWNTICLPFAMTESQVKSAFGNDVQLKDFTSYGVIRNDDDDVIGLSVTFGNATSIEANHPYIMKVSSPISYNEGFTVNGVNVEPVSNPKVSRGTNKKKKDFVGTYTAETIVPQYCLFLSGNKFWYSAGKTKMKAFRGYFDFVDVLTDVESASSRISLDIQDEGTTGVKTLEVLSSQDERCYDLQGRQVQKPQTKGFYIYNGKKVIR